MTKFVWSAKNREGKTIEQEAPADTMAESKEWMISEGFTDLVLLEDEIIAIYANGFPEKTFFLGKELKITPQIKEKVRHKPPASVRRTILDSFSEDKFFYLLAIFFCDLCMGSWSPNGRNHFIVTFGLLADFSLLGGSSEHSLSENQPCQRLASLVGSNGIVGQS